MKLKIAAAFTGAVVAVLLSRGKAPGTVSVTEVGEDGGSVSYDVLPGQIPDESRGVVVELSEAVQNAVADVVSTFGTKYDSLINISARENGIDPALLYRLLKQESHFREDIITGKVRSPVGALGIAQFMPATAREELGSESAALDPNLAIPGAARYLAKLIKMTGSIHGGVAAYNWGVGNVRRLGLDRAPRETRNYVASITGVSIGA